MQCDILCVGISTLDRVWLVDSLPTGGGKFRAHDYLELGGGMAANAAVAAARLGGRVAYWGRNGDDSAGRTMRDELAGWGVDVAQFRLYAGHRSSVSAIFVGRDGERTIVNYRDESMPTDAAWLPAERAAGCHAVHGDVRWPEGVAPAYRAARAAGVPTVLDGEIAAPEVFATLLPLTDHAIFSEPGLASFAGRPIASDADRLAALAAVRAQGCRVAAVTRGTQGVLWLDEHGEHHLPAYTVAVVDTTGAGDVFHGAYALAIGEGQSVEAAMRFSSAVAAMKCAVKGGRAGIPTRVEVDGFLANG
ncbi:PfkB family carbohydrate kinase [Noviherbaspirillum pedocola]|uniref:Sugar kinase n=1 Tax=Noviherbaspirillum pedocola TaxID=2801341 RepID=A0A934SYF9_9BURK|nr:PfkB family carbohydrate kinase [Noviherbaspirillum pedocola]MBK4738855.1 sugar kinase [Noviherbaspirillum pedocola]